MNSTEEIAVYKEPQQFYPSPTLNRRHLGYSYDFPEKVPKKDKKWSIGSFFRRKKKEESDSSSEDDQKKGFLGRRRRKSETKRKKPVKSVVAFDHVVIPPVSRNPHAFNTYNHHEDTGIFSDPSGGFANYVGRALPKIPPFQDSKESLNDLNNSRVSLGSGSADSLGRKSRRELAKARAEARRTPLKRDSSSDEDSQMSNSSLRIRSDENLVVQRESSFSRRSRAARTERYLKRHSKDGENPHNYLRLSKSDAENSAFNWKCSDESNRSPSRSPIVPKNKLSYTSLNSQNSSISGLSTIPPSHSNQGKYRVSNSTSNPSYKPPLSMNDYNNATQRKLIDNTDKYFPSHRSISCDANIHKAPSTEDNIIHVQFPITRPNRGYRNLSLIDTSQLRKAKHPPQPPPRDPSRMMPPHYFENPRPNTYYFDSNNAQSRSKSFNVHSAVPQQQNKRHQSFSPFNPGYRSTSEVHLPNDPFQIQATIRPSSTTPEPRVKKVIASRTNPESFNYLTDKKPRSRKPIFIQTSNSKSPSNLVEQRKDSPTQKAMDFWKQIEENVNNNKSSLSKPKSPSPQMFTSQASVKTQVFLPSVLQHDINSNNLDDNPRGLSPFKPVSPTANEIKECETETLPKMIDQDEVKRKSSNLEEALDELEAIYKSLRLGDEDLLERAEQREKENAEKKLLEANREPYPGWGINRGALSDSGFSYEPFDQVDSPIRKRIIKKSRIPDTKYDDMYNRKLKERAATISDPQSVISKVSYLLASPIHANQDDGAEKPTKKKSNEPDITFDDVVYRNVKHANSALKCVEPQPPFGIPIGPVTPAPNSDYLHAVPDTIYKPSFKPRKIPDIVKDDLAFRNLRKDSSKEPALPQFDSENVDLNYIKKRRAVRSLSANIGSLINKNGKVKQSDGDVKNEFKTLTDIADAMEIARKVLQEKEKKITSTRKAFMSDTDAYPASPVSKNECLKESRLNFLNGLKTSIAPKLGDDILSSKPPRGLTPDRKPSRSPTKESTPIPKSPVEEKSSKTDSTNSSLDDLLNAMAEEAKETTERITKELKMLGEEKQKRADTQKNKEEVIKKLSEIDAVSEHAKLCEKLLGCVVDSTDLMSSTKILVEEVKKIDSPLTESANVVMSCAEKEKIKEPECIESDHDYENLLSDTELNVDEVSVALKEDHQPVKCKSPFEEHKDKLIATFQDLRQSLEEIRAPLANPEDETASDGSEKRKTESIYDNLEEKTNEYEGEPECGYLESALECALDSCTTNINPANFTTNCDIVLNVPNNIFEDDSSSGVYSNCSCLENRHDNSIDLCGNQLDSLESLKSPKLVLETSKLSSKGKKKACLNLPLSSGLVLELSKNKETGECSSASESRTDTRQENSLRLRRSDSMETRHMCNDDSCKSMAVWYRDPTQVAIACSYGIACVHQLASLDFVAILGLLFAVISFIAALLL